MSTDIDLCTHTDTDTVFEKSTTFIPCTGIVVIQDDLPAPTRYISNQHSIIPTPHIDTVIYIFCDELNMHAICTKIKHLNMHSLVCSHDNDNTNHYKY